VLLRWQHHAPPHRQRRMCAGRAKIDEWLWRACCSNSWPSIRYSVWRKKQLDVWLLPNDSRYVRM